MVQESGSDWTISYRADERFLMNSTFKAMLCGAVLDRADEGTLDLGEMIEISHARCRGDRTFGSGHGRGDKSLAFGGGVSMTLRQRFLIRAALTRQEVLNMTHLTRGLPFSPAGAVTFTAVMPALGDCVSPAEQSIADTQQDQSVCAAMGASYESAAHSQCMLQQQQRRDQAQLILLEQARISYETDQTAQDMRDRRID